MPKSMQLLVVEDDVCARGAMVLPLCQDWRTRVKAEAGSYAEALEVLPEIRDRLHAVLVGPGSSRQHRLAAAFR